MASDLEPPAGTDSFSPPLAPAFNHPGDLRETRRCAAIFLDQLAIPADHKKRCDDLAKIILDTINSWVGKNPPTF